MEDERTNISDVTAIFAASPQKSLIIPQMNSQSSSNGTIIVKSVDPQAQYSSSTKLTSLLPKNLTANINKSTLTSLSNVKQDSTTLIPSSGILNTHFQSQASHDVPSYLSSQALTEITDLGPIKKTNIELQNDSGSFFRVVVKEPSFNGKKDESFQIQREDPTSNSINNIQAFPDYEKECISSSSNQMMSVEEDSSVKKKVMIEAFVKMVVCRKITEQTLDAKSGEVLETNVKTVSFCLLCFL